MSIRKKILLYVSATVILLIGITFVFIFTLFSEYREEEFQQRQKEKILTTLQFLTDVEEMNESIALAMDKITIHDFYDEKMLIYDKNKSLIYASIDDLPISVSNNILEQLSTENTWIETKEEDYDVIGIYIESKGKSYYGISKAYDEFGFTKLEYLRLVLLLVFFFIALILVLISNYIAKKIAKPIVEITKVIQKIDLDKETTQITLKKNNHVEIAILVDRFNDLMKRTNDAFNFQKHAINHISHELKTPITILVSNFEKMEQEQDSKKLKKLIESQKEGTKSLANIINTLLEIAKVEAGHSISKSTFRLDELLFDIVDELRIIHPDFIFKIDYNLATETDKNVSLKGNKLLIRSALTNLLINSIQYNSKNSTTIILSTNKNQLVLEVVNEGPIITDKERPFLFERFFRGENSKGKSGFGLGLILVKKIITLHDAQVLYKSKGNNQNHFIVSFPVLT
jgi:signal transduction histidine kinase